MLWEHNENAKQLLCACRKHISDKFFSLASFGIVTAAQKNSHSSLLMSWWWMQYEAVTANCRTTTDWTSLKPGRALQIWQWSAAWGTLRHTWSRKHLLTCELFCCWSSCVKARWQEQPHWFLTRFCIFLTRYPAIHPHLPIKCVMILQLWPWMNLCRIRNDQ